MNDNNQLITINQNAKLSLIKSKNLLDITRKILDKKDDDWIQRLWEWADENIIQERTYFPKTKSELLNISNLSVATSGDYRNYKEKDGKRFSHLINPKDGKPITHNLASVTVLYENCMIADALATAINVMGPTEGLAFANKNKNNLSASS